MSRCFPYPPPGYALSGASKEALIESIKLQKEREKDKAKEQRKEGKRKEKKEKRREEKQRRKEEKDKKKPGKEKIQEKKDKTHQNLDKSDVAQGHIDKKFPADLKGNLLKGSKTEPEQLERSTLTEEHGQAVHLRAPSTSSDSTENSNKRKRQSSPTEITRGHGKIIRIRLSSKKQNEHDASVKEQQHCSTSGRTEFCSQDKDESEIALRHHRENICTTAKQTDDIAQGFTPRSNPEQICSTSQPVNTLAPWRTEIPPATNAVMTKMQKMDLQYHNLFEKWVPPPLLDAPLDSDEQDWLFRGKKDKCTEKRCTAVKDNTVSCSSNSTLLPRAQYLQEVDVYALPFTVPF